MNTSLFPELLQLLLHSDFSAERKEYWTNQLNNPELDAEEIQRLLSEIEEAQAHNQEQLEKARQALETLRAEFQNRNQTFMVDLREMAEKQPEVYAAVMKAYKDEVALAENKAVKDLEEHRGMQQTNQIEELRKKLQK